MEIQTTPPVKSDIAPQAGMQPSPYNSPNTEVGKVRLKKKLMRIGVVKCGMIQGVFGLVVGLLVGIIYGGMFIIMGLVGASSELDSLGMGGLGVAGMGVVFLIAMPIIYGLMGFVGGVIMAAVFNLVTGWVGGIELELEDA